jgi:transcription termination/antitermination protein NusG
MAKKSPKKETIFLDIFSFKQNFMVKLQATIKGINGVVGFLGSKDNPVPLRQAEVNRILGNADENGAIQILKLQNHSLLANQLK